MTADIYSDLRMKSYVLTQMHMDVDLARELQPEEGALALDFDVRQKPDSEDDLLLELRVSVNPDEEDFEAQGFRFAVGVAGFFDVSRLKETHGDSWQPLFLNNGLSILYGVARIHIDSLSSVAPMGRFVLPCVNMQEFLSSRLESVDDEALDSE